MDEPGRRLTNRAQPLLEEAAHRSRSSARTRADRVTVAARSIVQVTLAAFIAWVIATDVVGHARPFFAPVSAIITLGLTLGQRARRAIEVVIGVTLGIAVGDMLVLVVGTGAWQLALVVGLTMTVALLLGPGTMFAQQAAVSAALVATLQPPTGGITFARAIDAVIGGSVGLAVNALVFPVHPERILRRAAHPVLVELVAVLEDVARGLADRDREAVQAALDRGRAIESLERDFEEALDVGRETVTVAPPRRRARRAVESYAASGAQVGLAVRNTRVLARAARRAVDLDENIPEGVPEAVRDLARAARALDAALGEEEKGPLEAVHAPALRAAGRATLVLEQTTNMSVTVIVGQIRSTAVDLLRSSGMSFEEAADGVRAAARAAEREEA